MADGRNKNLHKAKNAKNDEFYTRYEDIENEVQHYKEYLKGKSVYCPCDDYRFSNFVKYFKDNFEDLGLTELVATNYDIGDGAYEYHYDGKKEIIIKTSGTGSYWEHTDLRDKCNIVITNPPFSLFRDFMKWLEEG